jgi:hypothetical protein
MKNLGIDWISSEFIEEEEEEEEDKKVMIL